ncbi:MAG: hypothetical protein AAGA60_07860 [Cyanobacteria bacterium P01_E01_bin.42]
MKTVQVNDLEKIVISDEKEALRVESNGQLLGYFYPVVRSQTEIDAVWERMEQATEKVMTETGMDEETLVRTLTSD